MRGGNAPLFSSKHEHSEVCARGYVCPRVWRIVFISIGADYCTDL